MSKPKVLFYDIETSPNLGYTWGKYEQTVISYVQEIGLLSFAYKWEGESEVKCVSKGAAKTDKYVVKALYRLFQEADIIIAHNNDRFDQPIVTARMAYYGMKPPRVLQSVDTRKVAKRYFKFNSNSLDDLGAFLKLGRKQKHSGFDMWLGCMANKRSSWRQMIKYNKQDVVLLEKVYNRLKPWMQNHPMMGVKGSCPTCGSESLQKRGLRATHATVKQQWQCNDCHSWHLTPVKK
jgi:DNA polymerase elongation subunit (family B)